MNILYSDPFENLLENGLFDVLEAGPLNTPVKGLTLERDTDHKLILTTESEGIPFLYRQKHPVGTVRENKDAVLLKHVNGYDIKIGGVISYNLSFKDHSDQVGLTQEKSTAQFIEAILKQEEAVYIVDWLENVHKGVFVWPDCVEEKTDKNHTLTIGKGDSRVVISRQTSPSSLNRSAIFVKLGTIEFYLVWVKSEEKRVNSGYILYLSDVDEDERKKVRNCLSFVLGRPLITKGHSAFNSDWQLISFQSISPYTMNGQAFSIPSLPPTCLAERSLNEVDRDIFNKLVNAVYQHYDDFGFGHLMWQYWHAIVAPIHISAVYFGGCIEVLLKTYAKRSENKIKHTLLPKKTWSSIAQKLKEILDESKLPPDVLQILTNKIDSGLNQAPQGKVNEKALQLLSIQLSEIENEAWTQRNKAAHGAASDYSDPIKLIRDIKILKVLFHRIILRIIGVDTYIDYYSIRHPRKAILEPIGGKSGNGRQK